MRCDVLGPMAASPDHFLGPRYAIPTPCGPSKRNSTPRLSRAVRVSKDELQKDVDKVGNSAATVRKELAA